MNYNETDLVNIAKRENTTNRSYLVVNPLQGKHIPVSPSKAIDLFNTLATELKERYKAEKLLLVGFAETATAIGAQVAISLETKYIQTTREVVPNVDYLFFSEEHSHATEQKLVKNDIDRIIDGIDRIIFVEDEVTTGNTILNIIRILRREYTNTLKFSVASLLNGMTSDHLEVYEKEGIDIHYLIKTDHSKFGDVADKCLCDGIYFDADTEKTDINIIDIPGCMNARRLIDSVKYAEACRKMSENAVEKINLLHTKKILVMGTEECMYPAIYMGKYLEELGHEVKTHSTTRSPISVSSEESYPLHRRYTLQSLYDSERRTYIYDIDNYDYVLIVTDSELSDIKGLQSVVNAVKKKNSKISVIRWC